MSDGKAAGGEAGNTNFEEIEAKKMEELHAAMRVVAIAQTKDYNANRAVILSINALRNRIVHADKRLARMVTKASVPSFDRLTRLADWFSLGLRKRLKAVLGDYDAEIRRLRSERRHLTAHWNALLARLCFWWYVIRGPIDWLISYVVGAIKGRG